MNKYKNSRRNMYLFFIIKLLDWRVLWRHFRSTSGFIAIKKFYSQKFGVLGGISRLWLHLVGVIVDFDPYVSFWQIKVQLLKYISDKTEDKKSIDDFMLKRNDIGDFMLKRNGSYFAIILCETI